MSIDKSKHTLDRVSKTTSQSIFKGTKYIYKHKSNALFQLCR